MPFGDPWIYTAEDRLKHYHRLESDDDLDPLMERIGEARYVLLGEATHGTHEYYTWRARLSKRLIEEKGFSFVAVEGDWPDCYRINRFVKGYPEGGDAAYAVLQTFKRWPTWMWANWEIAAFMTWLREYNRNVSESLKVGFYGLDVYSLWESMESVLDYLQKNDPQTAALAIHVLNCFEPYEREGEDYARAIRQASARCTDEVINLLAGIRRKAHHYDGDREAGFNAEMNALVVANAEKYYRSMVSFGSESWNVRDAHMVATLNSLMHFHGKDAKAIVWEHNTHIGDARATDMGAEGLFNVGQLVREQHEQDGVVLVGFGSYSGSVIAARHWGAGMDTMTVPPALPGSVEQILHEDAKESKLMIFTDEALKERFSQWLGHRAIGVAYRPERDSGYYVPTILSSRYDAFIYLEETKALHPLHLHPKEGKMPDTYPFGF